MKTILSSTSQLLFDFFRNDFLINFWRRFFDLFSKRFFDQLDDALKKSPRLRFWRFFFDEESAAALSSSKTNRQKRSLGDFFRALWSWSKNRFEKRSKNRRQKLIKNRVEKNCQKWISKSTQKILLEISCGKKKNVHFSKHCNILTTFFLH